MLLVFILKGKFEFISVRTVRVTLALNKKKSRLM